MKFEFTDSQMAGRWALFELLRHLGFTFWFQEEQNWQPYDDRKDLRCHDATLHVKEAFSGEAARVIIYMRREGGMWVPASAYTNFQPEYKAQWKREGEPEGKGCQNYAFLYDQTGAELLAIKRCTWRDNSWRIRKSRRSAQQPVVAAAE